MHVFGTVWRNSCNTSVQHLDMSVQPVENTCLNFEFMVNRVRLNIVYSMPFVANNDQNTHTAVLGLSTCGMFVCQPYEALWAL
jgi:hypothetical protein